MDQLTQLLEENQRLRKAVDELSILNELSRVISSTMSLDNVIENVVKRSVRAVSGQQGMITLVDEIAPTEMKTLVRAVDSTTDHERFHLNQNVLGWMMINKKPLISNDIATDSRFTGVKVEGQFRSLVCVPLLVKNRLVGILAVFNKKDHGIFSDDDKRLLSIIATQSGQILENARLYEEEQKKMAMEKELIAAREVQMNLLPKHLPQVSHFEFAALTIPAQEIGGDFYDFIRMDDASYEIVIADVAGKGLPAALLATLGKGVLYAQALEHRSPQLHIRQSNRILRGSIPRKSFITMLLVVVQSASRSIVVSNAGHCYPLLFRYETKTVEPLTVKGMPLNFTDNILCEERTLVMEPNDCLLLYSDGASEANNGHQEMFGVDRLQEILADHGQRPTDQLLQTIVGELKSFSKGVPQSDDITLLAVKATP
ncbi:MAG: SpoIIE family protein phosphatase [Ignavibacteria bacterium]|nr:SpoIIE family protein phosphatase [Ignavibacteria bacterium]MBI3765642.1 SpoIIE family protein phosphatase [Ignavibacteriales bacterium]